MCMYEDRINEFSTFCTSIPRGRLLSDVPSLLIFAISTVPMICFYPLIFVSHLPISLLVTHHVSKSYDIYPVTYILVSLPFFLISSTYVCIILAVTAALSVVLLPFNIMNIKTSVLSFAGKCYIRSIHFHVLHDLIRCHEGVYNRQGLEYVYSVPNMIALLPPAKLFFLNPLLRKLEPFFLTQVSQPYKASTEKLKSSCIDITTNVNLACKNASFVDKLVFMGFYPDNAYGHTLGMQMGKGGAVNMMVWTRHAFKYKGMQTRCSNVKHPLLQVYVDACNLFHFVTGYVEVNITKKNGVEHAMWLVIDTSSYCSTLWLHFVNQTFALVFSEVALHLKDTSKHDDPRVTPKN